MGIDPTTGREVFVDRFGQYTYTYSAADIVRVGNARPLVEGVVSSNLSLKGFTLGLNFRYRLGAEIFNNAVFEKVENITDGEILNNQDKRALYDRWKKPGDVAKFKAISLTGTTPMSSRFVQEENVIIGESLNMGYEFNNRRWMKKAGLTSLRLNAYMNDIFYFSTITRERGIDYPFAKSASFSVRAGF
ncbi:hypothetical protein MKQ70_07360 [Chitinophaga sedimenti]|uniref:hypothetical protein n=1 Tax=Chitinophaga sedimenti TaxID=2033606 RepID=UPI0020065226|nr:hypothetical protein [Chitinophaga sedimenti]MCK7554830.1 hypothetical protein [Chitinophaga sedimenti]